MCTSLLLAACASDGSQIPTGSDNPFRPDDRISQRELRLAADELYRSARARLDSGDYAGALQQYEQLRSRYPFSDFATQAQLESVFAQYRSFQPEQALAGADRFLREHPRHEAVPYMLYLRGMINFERNASFFDDSDLVDTTKRDVGSLRRAFDDFSQLIGRFPDSPYVTDARQRMIYLRNRIAQNEMHVVRYYYGRGAWLAAARRAEAVIAEYPGAPATLDAVEMLARSYAELGLSEQASEARELLAKVEPVRARRVPVTPEKSWWQKLWPFGGDDSEQAPAPEAMPEDQSVS
ncbi:outer membrane protein assembly factor BamD [Algiphilus sp.]|uniref:outer membrane protein assembly factor BamD n=1 Tax=Algiphilus sp. TaxID=1872431 RepID=UPI0025BD6925|nr:outer membrane protein assembly factor BamD [Algiphilus sp.]MCK5768790.1 outer membrane protein assembly factor BamD [Algiphilus sp.]